MTFYLISDNADTLTGMRLAGIEGVIVHEKQEASDALDAAFADANTAIVLMTGKAIEFCREKVYDLKLNVPKPLIVEIPDRHGSANISETIRKYVGEAIGIKL